MKDVREMTEAELCSLTDEEIEAAVIARFLEDGVPLSLPELPGKEPVAPTVTPDVAVYECRGIDFMRLEDAERLSELISECPLAQTNYDYQAKQSVLKTTFLGSKVEEAPVTIKQLVSAAKKTQYSDEIARFEADDARWDAAVAARNSAHKLRQEARDAVIELIDEARAREAERMVVIGRIDEYLKLCDGQGDIAMRFFERAYPEALAKHPELRELFSEPAAMRPPPFPKPQKES